MFGVIFHWDHKQGLETAGQRVLFQTIDYTWRAYQPDLVVMVDEDSSFTLSVPQNVVKVNELDEALALFTDCTPVYVSAGVNAINLAEYEHPKNSVYIVGRDYGSLTVPDKAECVKILYPDPTMVLWASVALGIALYDRSVKL